VADRLTIVLPGAGYGPIGAAIRLPCLALEDAGAESVAVAYPPLVPSRPPLDEIIAHAADQVARILEEHSPLRVTVVAKSLGTVVLAAADLSLPTATEAIWLTPLFGDETVRAQAEQRGLRSLLVAGSADSAHDAEGHERVRAALGAESLLIAGANHALEVPGDVRATLDGLRQLVDAVERFAASDH
jgi:pimeloyl-ACP methyl ester carboxylesterase